MEAFSAGYADRPISEVLSAILNESGYEKMLRTEGSQERLAFVALTRAEKRLFLSESFGRNYDGSPRYPSRFLLDIDQSLLTFTAEPQEGLIAQARDYIENSLRWMLENCDAFIFLAGQRVRHQMFGHGTVLDVDMNKSAHVVQFDDMETPRRISFKAKLEKC